MKPLVSVIVPVYNVEKYIDRCVNSIIQQSYENLEIILIDDGSSDNTASLCDELALSDDRITVFHNTNHGPSFSRNFGLEKSIGEYITFIDSDDWIENDYVEKLIQPYYQEDIELTICPYYMDYPSYNLTIEADKRKLTQILNKDLSYLYYLTMGPCCKMYKKSIIDKFSIRFPYNIAFSEDRVFNYMYMENCHNYMYIDKVLYHYCHYKEGSLSQSRSMKSFEDAVRVLKLEREFLNKINALHKNQIIFESAWFYLGCFAKVTDGDNSYNGYKERFNKIRNIAKGTYSFSNMKKIIKSIILWFKFPWAMYIKTYWK